MAFVCKDVPRKRTRGIGSSAWLPGCLLLVIGCLVPLEASAAKLLTASPTALDFGQQLVGTTSAPQVIALSNSGSGVIFISSITITGPFAFAGTSVPVKVGSTPVEITVVFTPTVIGGTDRYYLTLVSNAANSPMQIPLTGEGIAPSPSVSLAPTSLDFGSQAVDTTSLTQTVTVANIGTADLVVDSMSLPPAEFNVVGPMPPVTIPPAGSVSYSVTFTPTAAQPYTGTWTLNSNAATSPTSVTLTGTGTAAPAPGISCGLLDATVLTPVDYDLDLRPAKAGAFSDPVFGCQLLRLTDGPVEMGMGVHHEYSTMYAMNATNTLVLVHGASRGFRIVDTTGGLVVDEATLGVCQTCEPRWHHTDPNVLYSRAGNQIRRFDVSARASTVIRSFPEYSSITFCGGEGDLSDDSDHLAVCGGGQIFVYTISTNTKGPAIAVSGLDAAYMTPDNNVLVAAGGANKLYNSQMSLLRTVTPWYGHKDVGRDVDGQEVLVIVASNDPSPAPGCSGNGIEKIRLSDGVKTCLLPLYWGDSTHVSLSQNGWALISNTDVGSFSGGTASPPPCSTCLTNWTSFAKTHLNELTLVKLDGSEVRRLAHTRSRRLGSYWFTPRAGLSRDASLIVFDSNFGQQPTTDYTDVYLIRSGAAPAAALLISVAPSSLDFGSQAVGTTSLAQTVTVTNVGTADLVVDSMSLPPVEFSVAGPTPPVTIPPASSVSYSVAFAPTAAQSYTGTWTLNSNAAASPTTVNLAGTGVFLTAVLNVSPTSLGFGSQLVGTTSAPQTATLTNAGTASLTISNVSTVVPFAFTGWLAPTTLLPGQSLSLLVTFAPTAAGSFNGTLVITSDTAGSPHTVALSGAGTVASAGGPCGMLDDRLIHIPLDYATFVPPARGQSFTDPVFGCTITRLSDGPAQFGTAVHHEYASMSPFNSDNTRILLLTETGAFFVVDPQGNLVVSPGALGIASGNEPRWSTTNPQLLYFHQGNQLKRRNLGDGSTTVLRAFTQYGSVNFGGGESDISDDGDHTVIVGDNRFVHVYQFSTDTLGPALDLAGRGFDWFDMTPNNNVLANYGSSGASRFQGMELFNQNMVFLRQVIPFAGHADRGRDVNGDEVVVVIASNDLTPAPGCGGNGIEKVRLSDSQKTCLLPMYWGDSTHISVNGSQWALVSNTDIDPTANPPATLPGNWADLWGKYFNELTLVKLDGSEVRRLGHHRTRRFDGYWHTPRAAVSRDGSLVLFDSNFARYPVSSYTDAYLIH